jgi:hypothetical protein
MYLLLEAAVLIKLLLQKGRVLFEAIRTVDVYRALALFKDNEPPKSPGKSKNDYYKNDKRCYRQFFVHVLTLTRQNKNSATERGAVDDEWVGGPVP